MASDPFVDYYEKKSLSADSIQHFIRLRDLLLRALPGTKSPDSICVADIGCNAGAFSEVWAAAGCRVSGVDINASLVEIARARTADRGYAVDFQTASAVALPWPDSAFDIVVMPELLEHVADWRACLNEAARVTRPGGLLYVSTTNRLCPLQDEFTLPGYSWYPAWVKRRCLDLSLTTHREWVNHATYPAVTWFDAYWLGAEFRRLGLEPLDRFDLFARYGDSTGKRLVGRITASLPPARFVGHVLTPGLRLLGRKL